MAQPRHNTARRKVRGDSRGPLAPSFPGYASHPSVRFTVTLRAHAEIRNGTPETTALTVTENARTLKFATHSFEQEQQSTQRATYAHSQHHEPS